VFGSIFDADLFFAGGLAALSGGAASFCSFGGAMDQYRSLGWLRVVAYRTKKERARFERRVQSRM